MAEQLTLKRSLSTWQVVMIGLGYMTPMVVFDTFGIVSEATNGHVPIAYVLALVAMLFTAFSYGKMVKAYPVAGSAYSYTSKTMNSHLGFMVGWAILLDYLFLPMVNALLTQIYFSALFPDVPAWIWIVGFTLIMTAVNIFSVNITANFNTILVVCQVVVMTVFTILDIQGLMGGEGYGAVFTLGPFFKEGMDWGIVVAGATILCFSFLGFDAVTTLSEEAHQPTKTIPRAIMLVALIGGVMFIAVSYFTQAFFPDISRFNDYEAASPEIALMVGGKIFQLFFLAGTFTGTLASGITSHASVSRLLYVMGRDKVLPFSGFFSYVSPRWRTPRNSVLLVGALCFTALIFDLATVIAFINFGALIAFTFVNLSVIAHYAGKKKQHVTPLGFLNYVTPHHGAAFIAVPVVEPEASSFKLGGIWAITGCHARQGTKLFSVKPRDGFEAAWPPACSAPFEQNTLGTMKDPGRVGDDLTGGGLFDLPSFMPHCMFDA
jgi:putrescine importer